MPPSSFISWAFALCCVFTSSRAVTVDDFLVFQGAKCDGSLNSKQKLFPNVLRTERCVALCAENPDCKVMTYEAEARRCKLYKTCTHFLTERDGFASAVLDRVTRISQARFWVPISDTDCSSASDGDCMEVTISRYISSSIRHCETDCEKANGCEAYQYMMDTSLCVLYRQRRPGETKKSIFKNGISTTRPIRPKKNLPAGLINAKDLDAVSKETQPAAAQSNSTHPEVDVESGVATSAVASTAVRDDAVTDPPAASSTETSVATQAGLEVEQATATSTDDSGPYQGEAVDEAIAAASMGASVMGHSNLEDQSAPEDQSMNMSGSLKDNAVTSATSADPSFASQAVPKNEPPADPVQDTSTGALVAPQDHLVDTTVLVPSSYTSVASQGSAEDVPAAAASTQALTPSQGSVTNKPTTETSADTEIPASGTLEIDPEIGSLMRSQIKRDVEKPAAAPLKPRHGNFTSAPHANSASGSHVDMTAAPSGNAVASAPRAYISKAPQRNATSVSHANLSFASRGNATTLHRSNVTSAAGRTSTASMDSSPSTAAKAQIERVNSKFAGAPNFPAMPHQGNVTSQPPSNTTSMNRDNVLKASGSTSKASAMGLQGNRTAVQGSASSAVASVQHEAEVASGPPKATVAQTQGNAVTDFVTVSENVSKIPRRAGAMGQANP